VTGYVTTACTDGSALKNPHGPAGWAWYVSETSWAAGGFAKASNQVAELHAILALLRAVPRDQRLLIRTDSDFAIKTLTSWMAGWKRAGWRKKDGQPPANLALVQELDRALAGRPVRFEWVRGHSGDRGNEIADRLCTAASAAVRDGRPVATGPGWTGPAVPASGGAAATRPLQVPGQRRPTDRALAGRPRTTGAARPAAARAPERSSVRLPDVGTCPACDATINPLTMECRCSD
jgi:ribonuclease HI